MQLPNPDVALTAPITASTPLPLPATEQVDMGPLLADRD
jgi:hypothetical protein